MAAFPLAGALVIARRWSVGCPDVCELRACELPEGHEGRHFARTPAEEARPGFVTLAGRWFSWDGATVLRRERNRCPSQHGNGYGCTRELGHAGEHVDAHYMLAWPNDSELAAVFLERLALARVELATVDVVWEEIEAAQAAGDHQRARRALRGYEARVTRVLGELDALAERL